MDHERLSVDGTEPNQCEEEQGNGLDWLLGKESPEIISIPMDTIASVSR